MRFPGSTRSRFVAILILAAMLLIVDGVRRAWKTPWMADTASQDASRPVSVGLPRIELAPIDSSRTMTKTPAHSLGGESNGGPFEPFTIEALGREFLWHYRLPGPDGRLHTPDDRQAADELHVPLDTPIRLLVRSSDYVYAYSVPGLQLRRIAIPELTYRLEFVAHEEACYDVVVDPMCRVRPLHGDLMGHLIVEDRAAYLAWLETLPLRRDAATKDDEILGEDE